MSDWKEAAIEILIKSDKNIEVFKDLVNWMENQKMITIYEKNEVLERLSDELNKVNRAKDTKTR